MSVDPLAGEFPWNSAYAYAENDVIRSIDLDGLEKLIVTKEASQYMNSFFKIVNSNNVLKQQLRDPINNPDLKEKVHIYFAFTEEFGSKNSKGSNGVTYKNSIVSYKINSIVEHETGDYAVRIKYSRQDIIRDKRMFLDSNLPLDKIKDKLGEGVEVYVVLLNRKKSGSARDNTLIHEIFLHLKKFEKSNMFDDHIEGFGKEYYDKLGVSPLYSPEKTPENSDLGKIQKLFQNEKNKE
ncbi:hypothetical protein J2X69_002428 [Algoriphagus sp. 4150]|uniref:hypothetical protein n=1 Tax=Algoriphagus sp. 4150 TaxID=2817756 RepID=UPI00285CDE88|nr:hypothetical protein [Algoriphagus sp. 4150]MDR7130081.1 hypothetical protein [Algoriphagus sp. 4150]